MTIKTEIGRDTFVQHNWDAVEFDELYQYLPPNWKELDSLVYDIMDMLRSCYLCDLILEAEYLNEHIIEFMAEDPDQPEEYLLRTIWFSNMKDEYFEQPLTEYLEDWYMEA